MNIGIYVGILGMWLKASHLVRQVESCNTQGPETAEHGENTEAQVVPRRHQEEIVFTLWVTWVLTLHKIHKTLNESDDRAPFHPALSISHLCASFQRKGRPKNWRNNGKEEDWVILTWGPDQCSNTFCIWRIFYSTVLKSTVLIANVPGCFVHCSKLQLCSFFLPAIFILFSY